MAGWLTDESGILVYDNYDIWKLDPAGKKKPINITNGYGRRNNIKFRIPDRRTAMRGLSDKATILLSAFNTINKHNGFYQKNLQEDDNPKLLTMGPYIFCHIGAVPPGGSFDAAGMEPVKAHQTNVWLVMRQSPTEGRNLFVTKDFKSYTALTKHQLHKDYNWLTTELVTWKQFDSTTCQGVLYKPENFDPQKKYPIIFYYYEQLSFLLFSYPRPDFSIGPIDIPWYVSHGYLVFTPDIHYKAGLPGPSAYNSVVSAAAHLARMPFVDGLKMGITGHSFGGYETNYLITHTNIFAAAAEGAGTSNLISGYGTLRGSHGKEYESGEKNFEIGQYRMGVTLWQRPDLYISNSPIFKADKVTTPLLIMHNRGDRQVNWNQGIELFTGLRRLQKKVWMLEYDDGGHSVAGDDAKDYTIRMMQFFDHYLKGAPAPKWMTQGIPARLKGIETGLALDPAGSCGKDCIVCKKQNSESNRANRVSAN
jgi:dienelactone hydrolase